MASKKGNIDEIEITSIDATPEEVVASMEVPTEVHLDYVGPDYDKGIEIHGSKDLIRPREFSPAQIGNFTAKHPQYTCWWSPAGK